MIGPKAYILEETPGMEMSFENQNLPYLKELMSVDSMGRMSDMNQIIPQFVMSSLLEEDFKPFLDQVVKKTVLNGDQVPMSQSRVEESNRQSLIKLYRRFFFGDPITDLEYAIEREYISEKMNKANKYLQTKVTHKLQASYISNSNS